VTHHVLLLDIDEAPDAALSATLAQCDYDVSVARSVAAAAELLAVRSFDIAVVGAAGAADAERTLAALPGLPVAVICPFDDSETTVRWLEAGADTVLAGPPSRRELAARLDALLRVRQSVLPARYKLAGTPAS